MLPFAVRPSVRPSGNSLPASPPTLLMLESPNLYAWYPYAYRWWQRIWNFSTSSSFEIIQILVILPKNAIFLVIFHEIGSHFLSVWGKAIYIIYQTGFIVWLPDPLRQWKYRWRGRILKENCLLLQFTSISSYTIDARINKPICMIPLWIQMVATYLKFFYIFQFWNNADFSDFTQKWNFYGNLSCDFQITPANGNIDRGSGFWSSSFEIIQNLLFMILHKNTNSLL